MGSNKARQGNFFYCLKQKETNMTTKAIDLNRLMKGDYIDTSTLEELTGYGRATSQFQLEVLKFKSKIDRYMRKNGIPVTIKIENCGIKILTDSESTVYNDQRFHAALKGAFSSHYRQLEVDTKNLTDDEKKEHNRRLDHQGRYLQAIKTVGIEIDLQPHRRMLPKVLENEREQDGKEETK